MTIVLLKSASEDIQVAYHFYNAAFDGLGDYFKETIFSEIDSLIYQAGIHPIVKGYFRKLTRTFPFAIYYKVYEKQIMISAVLDCRRNPNSNKDRLKSFDL